ncbi:hypothetical protein CVT24_012068 [Panaeolus cyanescens]|uniref:G domain-containing protein n=1 Tax=Panaeolus cyanescens TaxID=181874 RepID=A0A409YNA6_9AGAR|nr:hypothetical protein CVT24_012068 [Panaeolus cyanescens]
MRLHELHAKLGLRTHLLLGATGSGKSSFIEALAGKNHQLGISGSTLESVTQDVQVFKVVNMEWKWVGGDSEPVLIVDTPGFSDSKMSEVEIVNKVNQWIKKHDRIDHIYYFCRITDTRIPGSAWRLMKIIKSLGINPKGLKIITSMWDTIGTDGALKRAEGHFSQLRDVIWKDEIEEGASIVKFENTQSSAIEILTGITYWAYVLSYTFGSQRNSLIAQLVFPELLDRIQNSQQERQAYLDDRIRLLSNPDPDLESTLMHSHRDVDERLANYIHQLVEFGTPPEGVNVNPQSIAYQSLLNITLDSQKFVHTIEKALSQLPSLPSSTLRKTELKKTLRVAIGDYITTYVSLHTLAAPPFGSPPFTPTVKLTTADHIKLKSLMKAKQLQLRWNAR